jgi:DNA-binding NtrC family response regulator
MKHLLVVDDELGSRESLRTIFDRQYEVSVAESANDASRMLSDKRIDLVLLDVIMPERDGLSLLREIQDMYPDVPVVMVSASTSVEPVVAAIKSGAFDYVTKPFDVGAIRHTVERALETSKLQRQVKVLQGEVSREYPIDGIIGESESFRLALADAEKAAAADTTVLITGESGTGKELVARCIHAWSQRRDDPFVAVHCASLPEALMESELFGHEKGAFTSADKQKPGRFDLAAQGSLFFDEVSEMSLSTQVKLLRVLQEKEFMRVGGTRVIRTDARIICASGKDLKQQVENANFRNDLFYRLSVIPVCLPPLRERREDIPLLATHYYEKYRQQLDSTTEGLLPETMAILCGYDWPGNVRELKNVLERILVLHGKSRYILPEHLPDELRPNAAKITVAMQGNSLEDSVNSFERQLIENALKQATGVQTRAADALGTTRRILKYRMEKLNIPTGYTGKEIDA